VNVDYNQADTTMDKDLDITFRQATDKDLASLKNLAVKSWDQFQRYLTIENWKKLYSGLTDDTTYTELLDKAQGFVATSGNDEIIGMAFLVPRGNPTDIYDKEWCYIRFVTVDPNFGGQGIGRKLTNLCIAKARENKEKLIALHTSELMDNARHVYESIGFTILKEIGQRYGERYWLYTLELKENTE
jgi:ribosomal protein S18 acetylase RimI-like enzyme